MENKFDKLKNMKLGKNGFIILILVGVLLVIIVWPSQKTKNAKDEATTEDQVAQMIQENAQVSSNSMQYYQKSMEKELEQVLSQMDGVGKVKVMITLKSNEKTIVEKDVKTDSNRLQEEDDTGGERTNNVYQNEVKTVYITDGAGKQVPYVIQTMTPQVEGVLVVAQGGDNVNVNINITQAIQALFSIEIHKIRVVKMKS